MNGAAPGGAASGGAILVCSDLIFATKVASTGRALGMDVAVVRPAADLAGRAAPLLLVDLESDGALEAIARGRAAHPSARIIAFGPHVEPALLAAARQRGADEALPRSAFARRLPEILGGR